MGDICRKLFAQVLIGRRLLILPVYAQQERLKLFVDFVLQRIVQIQIVDRADQAVGLPTGTQYRYKSNDNGHQNDQRSQAHRDAENGVKLFRET